MPIEKIINSALKFLDVRLSRLGDKIVTALSKSQGSDLGVNIDKQSRILATAVARIEKAIDKIKDPKFTGEIKIDTTRLETELSSAVKDIKSTVKPVDIGGIQTSLKMIHTAIKASNESNSKALKDGMVAIAEALESLDLVVPDTFKIDKMQMRELASGNASSIYGGAVPARKSIITRVTMADADTEYSHTFNKHAVSWRIKLEAQNAKFNYSWTTGKLKVSGDASEYISIPANWLDSRDNTEYGSRTIFFESPSSSQNMEIEEGIA